jgi:hypothetical protein
VVAKLTGRGIGIVGRAVNVSNRGLVRDKLPDSENLYARYDFSEYDTSETSNIEDLSGNRQTLDTGSFSGYTTINGVQAADFDGSDDELGGPLFSDVGTFAKYAVVEVDSGATNENTVMFNRDNESGIEVFQYRLGDEWRCSGATGISANTSFHLHTYIRDQSNNVEYRVNSGDETTTGTMDRPFNRIHVGNDPFRGRFFQGAIGELLIYNANHDFETRDEVEDYLSSKWY